MKPFARNPHATTPKQIKNEKLNNQAIRLEIESVTTTKIAEYFREKRGSFMHNSVYLAVQ
jgi:hypothetical protein